jgi:hypothetical protein
MYEAMYGHDIMDKFIILNVHDATPKKTPKIILDFFPIFSLVYEKKSMLKKCIKILKKLSIIIIMMKNYQYLIFIILYFKYGYQKN